MMAISVNTDHKNYRILGAFARKIKTFIIIIKYRTLINCTYFFINSQHCKELRHSSALADSLSNPFLRLSTTNPTFANSVSPGTLVAFISKNYLTILARLGYYNYETS